MTRLIKLALGVAAFWLILWGLAAATVPRLAKFALPRLAKRIEGAGLALENLDFDTVHVSPSLLKLDLRNVSAKFDLTPENRKSVRSTFHTESTIVYLDRPFQKRGGVIVDGFEVSFDPSDRPKSIPFDGFSKGYVHIHSLPLTNPKQAIVEIFDGLDELFLANNSTGDFEFSGEVLVRVDDSTLPALIYTERQGEQFRLRFSKPDITKIAEAAEIELSDEQVDLVSLFPLRVPAIVEITEAARDLSKKEFPGQEWLEDALRHVSWSYRLTQEFGADFAKQVTDAHEKNPGNTPNEHLMDYNNNAVGRIFAESGVRYEDLPLHVLAHEDIVRNPDEVETRTRLLR
ncbi:MAG: hypothetical protein P8Y44_06510 [Acidobacteriota bacterium]